MDLCTATLLFVTGYGNNVHCPLYAFEWSELEPMNLVSDAISHFDHFGWVADIHCDNFIIGVCGKDFCLSLWVGLNLESAGKVCCFQQWKPGSILGSCICHP
jgi:hypothetical protein